MRYPSIIILILVFSLSTGLAATAASVYAFDCSIDYTKIGDAILDNPSCNGDNICRMGDSVNIEMQMTGDCPDISEEILYLQVDARSDDGVCDIQAENINNAPGYMQGIQLECTQDNTDVQPAGLPIINKIYEEDVGSDSAVYVLKTEDDFSKQRSELGNSFERRFGWWKPLNPGTYGYNDNNYRATIQGIESTVRCAKIESIREFNKFEPMKLSVDVKPESFVLEGDDSGRTANGGAAFWAVKDGKYVIMSIDFQRNKAIPNGKMHIIINKPAESASYDKSEYYVFVEGEGWKFSGTRDSSTGEVDIDVAHGTLYDMGDTEATFKVEYVPSMEKIRIGGTLHKPGGTDVELPWFELPLSALALDIDESTGRLVRPSDAQFWVAPCIQFDTGESKIIIDNLVVEGPVRTYFGDDPDDPNDASDYPDIHVEPCETGNECIKAFPFTGTATNSRSVGSTNGPDVPLASEQAFHLFQDIANDGMKYTWTANSDGSDAGCAPNDWDCIVSVDVNDPADRNDDNIFINTNFDSYGNIISTYGGSTLHPLGKTGKRAIVSATEVDLNNRPQGKNYLWVRAFNKLGNEKRVKYEIGNPVSILECTGTWTVPIVPEMCKGKTVGATVSGVYLNGFPETPGAVSIDDTVEADSRTTGSIQFQEDGDNNVPFVSIRVVPDSAKMEWEKSATVSIECMDAEGDMCDDSSYRMLKYSSKPADGCPQTYASYQLTSPQSIDSHSWVCGTAKDLDGNAGFSVPVEVFVDSVKPEFAGFSVSCSYQQGTTCWARKNQNVWFTTKYTEAGGSTPSQEYITFTKDGCTPGNCGCETGEPPHGMECSGGNEIRAMVLPDKGDELSGIMTNNDYIYMRDAYCDVTDFYGCGGFEGQTTDSEMRWEVLPGSEEAEYKIWSLMYDQAGNYPLAYDNSYVATGYWLKIDNTPPVTAVSCDNSGCISGAYSSDVQVGLSATDNNAAGDRPGSGVSSIKYCVDTTAACTPNTEYTGEISITCPDGSLCEKYVKFRARDHVGNVEDMRVQMITIDKRSPGVGIYPLPAWTKDDYFTVSWYAEAGADVEYFHIRYQIKVPPTDYGEWVQWIGSISADEDNSAVYGPAEEGNSYKFSAAGTSSAGQTSVYSPGKSTTIDLTPPACEITDLQPYAITEELTVEWGGTDIGQYSGLQGSGIKNYLVQYQQDGGGWQTLVETATSSTTSHDITLEDASIYGFRCKAYDNAGWESAWSQVKEIAVDLGPPESHLNAQPEWTNKDVINVTWCFDTKEDGTLDGFDPECSLDITCYDVQYTQTPDIETSWRYIEYPNSEKARCPNSITSDRWIPFVHGGNDGSTWYFRIKSKDYAGQQEEFHGEGSGYVHTSIDQTPPVLTADTDESEGSASIDAHAKDVTSGVDELKIHYEVMQEGQYIVEDEICGPAEPNELIDCSAIVEWAEKTDILYEAGATDRAGNEAEKVIGFITEHPLANFHAHSIFIPLGQSVDLKVRVKNIDKETLDTVVVWLGEEWSASENIYDSNYYGFIGAEEYLGENDKTITVPLEPNSYQDFIIRINSLSQTGGPYILHLNARSTSFPLDEPGTLMDSDTVYITIGYPPEFPGLEPWAIALLITAAGLIFYFREYRMRGFN